jgi:hypothetical protein
LHSYPTTVNGKAILTLCLLSPQVPTHIQHQDIDLVSNNK